MAVSLALQKKTNSIRCYTLILEGGGYFAQQLLLQETVDNGAFNNVDEFLAANKEQIRILITSRKVPDNHYFIMFPQDGTPTDLKQWDITLVFIILTNFVRLNQAQIDAIQEVRQLRNYLIHIENLPLSESIFQDTWAFISSTLTCVCALLTNQRCQTVIANMIDSIKLMGLSSAIETKLNKLVSEISALLELDLIVKAWSSKGTEATEMVTIDKKLSYEHKELLGKGAKSIVYEGHYENMPVAVKQIECKDKTDAEQTKNDIKILPEKEIMSKIEKKRNVNIVGFYYSNVKDKYLYLALELCQGTLAKYVESANSQLQQSFPPLHVVNSMASGLQYLHSQKVAHRDLKPENVMYISKGEQIERFVLGDFGASKCTIDDIFSFSGQTGTMGYIPNEMCKAMQLLGKNEPFKSKLNIKSDIFALGCLIYFTNTFGEHPFGPTFDRQYNIKRGNEPTLNSMKKYLHPCKVLLEKILSHNPNERPTVTEILSHPALWSHKKIMDFFKYSSNTVEQMYKREPASIGRLEVVNVITGDNWISSLPKKLNEHCNSRENKKQYDKRSSSVAGLLRFIRNTEGHLSEYKEDVQNEVGHAPEKQAIFWMDLHPKLLMHVHSFITGNVPSVPEKYQIQVAPPSEENQDRESVPASTSPAPSTSKETS